MSDRVTVIGGGLAGCEAAFQLASRGVEVELHEMRPGVSSPAHHTGGLAELVCSNSFKSTDEDTCAGVLKRELDSLGSLLLACACACAVPAGGALAVDRERFSTLVTAALDSMPTLTVRRAEVSTIPDGHVIVASGPLTSDALQECLSVLVGADRLAFFDAAAPIVEADSVDGSRCFPASRYSKGSDADYLNCPMDRNEYEEFISALVAARTAVPHDFEQGQLFHACQPIEEIARKGRDAPRFGALKPVGLTDPRTGQRPWAVLQLRAENSLHSAYNLVGCQTSLTFDEQRRVFGLVPALAHARFLRYGVVHRNTFLDSPRLLAPDLSLRSDPRVRFAGQVTGTEGYTEAVASGLIAALGTFASIGGLEAPVLPPTTATGALLRYATDPLTTDYQPMHANFGLLPPLDAPVRGRRERAHAHSQRAIGDLAEWVALHDDLRVRETRALLGSVLAVTA